MKKIIFRTVSTIPIGEIVKQQRAVREMSREELCEVSGVCLVSLYKIENKGHIPVIDSACKIAKALNIDVRSFCDIVVKGKTKRYIKLHNEAFSKAKKLYCLDKEKEKRGKVKYPLLHISFDQSKCRGKFVMLFKETGMFIRLYRTRKGLSLMEVEAETGIWAKNLSKVETGNRPPSLFIIFSLAEYLNFKAVELFQLMMMEKMQASIARCGNEVEAFIEEYGNSNLDVDDIIEKRHLKNNSKTYSYQRKNSLIILSRRQNFLSLLKGESNARGLSCKDIADLTGLNKRLLQTYFTSQEIPSILTIEKICDGLDMDKKEMFEAALQDRVEWFKERHYHAFEEYKEDKNNRKEKYFCWRALFGGYVAKMERTFNYIKTSKILRELREKTGMTDFELSRTVGCSFSGVVQAEGGRGGPSPNYIYHLCQLTDFDSKVLLDCFVDEKTEQYVTVYRKEYQKILNQNTVACV